ncbi:MAG: Gfo/Idh/MocA family oxidoreductase [Kiritimatiellia bacterium]|nr:Gfo/Idh/MocA family oxidoreductase [Kiritimatiellia bacterium]
MNQVRAGFLGCGVFITRYHLESVKKNPLFQIRALCDLDTDRLADRKQRFGCEYATTHYKDMLADPDLDLIFIGTEHNLHCRFIVELAEAGKNIFVEKPMCITAEECKRVVDAVQSNRVKLMVGYNRRFAPAMVYLKEKYRQIRQGRNGIYLYRIMDDFLTWDNQEANASLEIGGGKILGECCHIFDLVSWFSDSEPIRIFAQGDMNDACITLHFANGDNASIVTGGVGSQYYPKELMEVYCHSSTLALYSFCETLFSSPQEFEVKTYKMRKNRYSDEQGYAAYVKSLQAYKKEHRAGAVTPTDQPNPDKGHYEELTAYARALLDGRPSPVDEFSGSRATILALKAIESIRTGKAQEIQPQEYDFGYPRT